MNIDAKIFNEIIANKIQLHIKGIYTKWPSGIYSWNARMIQYMKIDQCNATHWQNERKETHMIVSVVTEEACDKIHHPFMIKTLNKWGIDRGYLNVTKVIYEKLTMNIILNSEKLKTCPLRSGTRKGCWLFPLTVNIVLKVLARTIRQEKVK